MFKSNKHKSDRLGERVEFRFSSFQAFQIPKGWDKLVLSLISVDTGKTIAKANKATVRGGTCQWTETFSESVWTPQNNASTDVEECVFKIVVSMGSHKSGILGEIIINLTDYMSSRDSGSLSLPLQKCNYGTILQVRIQCLKPKRGFRVGRSSVETPSYREDLHTNYNDLDSKLDGSDNMLNRNLGYSSTNHLGVSCAEDPINRDASFSASRSLRSSDSEDTRNLNGRSDMGRQNSSGSHISATSSVGPTDMFRSNPSSFSSRASGSNTPVSVRATGSSKDFLEGPGETIEERQDEPKMWERHALKFKLDVEKYKKESSDKSRRQAELVAELKAAYSKCDSLKQEVEQLKSLLEDATAKQTSTRAAKNEVMLRVQKELEGEVTFLKESNANLSLQLKKSQEANVELVSILEELEETVEKQRLEIDNFAQQSPMNEHEGDVWNIKLLAMEAEWAAKLSTKEEEIIKLEAKLSGMQNAEYSSEKESSRWESDLIKEIEQLRAKVQELERDCSELTEENLELICKMKQSGKGVGEEKESENSEQLKLSLEEATAKQTATRVAKNEVVLRMQQELEDEMMFLKESNANLSLQLKKSQEANVELISILEELEETVEKQRLEIDNFVQQSPVNEHEGDMWNKKLVAVEAEWAAKLSTKEEKILKLEAKLSGMQNAEYPIDKESSHGDSDLMKEIEELRERVQELERDCSELTEENLELICKMKQSGRGVGEVGEEQESENSMSEVDFLKSQIHSLEEELRSNEMNLEKICADLDVELQYFKDQTSHLDIKLRESQLEVEEKSLEIKEMQQKLENKQNGARESELEELKIAVSVKEKEIDILRHDNVELEVLLTNMQRDKAQLEENLASVLRESSITSKCLEDIQCEMTLNASANKMFQRKLIELESSKNELEIQLVELEEENIQLSERLSGLEAQLRYMADDKESLRLELEDSSSLVSDLKDEVAKLQIEIETRNGELKHNLLEVQKRFSETQEESEYLKGSHSKLQLTTESLIEDNGLLQKSNGDLQRQKLELHEHSANLEIELTESQKNASEFLKKIEFLDLKLSSLQDDVVSTEKMLTSQLESIFHDQKDQEEKINQAKLMANQIDVETRIEVETLKGEISQLCATHDERQKMASDAILEVSSLRSDKIKLESYLQEAHAKIRQYETEIQSLRQESSMKVQGSVNLLNASKQSEDMLMSDIEHVQEATKSEEKKLKSVARELESKIRASDYEKQQIVEENTSLKVQVQKIAHLQDEILVLKSAIEEAKFENRKLEELLESVSKECEGLKTERISFVEKISDMQKALLDHEDNEHSRIALEEKLLRLEGDLGAKEASSAHEIELENEINQIKRANSECQRKIRTLEENCELMRKAQSGVETHSSRQQEEQSQTQEVAQLADADQTKRIDASKIPEAPIQELRSKVRILENELAESVETNNMYKIQLQGLMAEKQSSVSRSESDMGSQMSSRIASLETELKDIKERYLHMSLQYAEVEAQRQELILKLKASTKGKGWFS